MKEEDRQTIAAAIAAAWDWCEENPAAKSHMVNQVFRDHNPFKGGPPSLCAAYNTQSRKVRAELAGDWLKRHQLELPLAPPSSVTE